jgi:large subunit ribosomal protein L25
MSMAEVTLIAEPGRPTGSAASRRLRASGRVPAVVYGHGQSGTAVSVDARDLRHALSGDAGLNQLLSLQVGPETHLALARSLQRHPVRHTVVHVDFLIVRRDEVIAADVPIVLVGEAKAVEQDQGIVEQQLTTLSINATPDRIPPHLEVDISGLAVGDTVRVGDIRLPSGVTTDVAADEPIVLATVSRAAIELEAAEAAGAEGAAEAAGEAAGRGGGPAAGGGEGAAGAAASAGAGESGSAAGGGES